VEIIVTENTVAKGLISVNKVCHCVTYDWWKTMEIIWSTNLFETFWQVL